jgi:hypothetical protein
MSNSAVASARKRRAGITTTPPPSQIQSQQPQNQPSGLTLPQVIALIDSRLVKLETFMNTKQDNIQYTNNPMKHSEDQDTPSNINEIIEEFQQRFLLLAEEINLLKDTVLKLQTYTMDVNKTLLEERINILSDLGDNGERFVLQQEEVNDMLEKETLEYENQEGTSNNE